MLNKINDRSLHSLRIAFDNICLLRVSERLKSGQQLCVYRKWSAKKSNASNATTIRLIDRIHTFSHILYQFKNSFLIPNEREIEKIVKNIIWTLCAETVEFWLKINAFEGSV